MCVLSLVSQELCSDTLHGAFYLNGAAGLDGPLALDPSSTVFHYAQCLFEGMKAYRDVNGKVTLFRPDMNMLRMNRSAQRIALPVSILSLHRVHRQFESI